MKNIIKLSLLTFGIALSSSLSAQEAIKKDASTTADKLEAPSNATDTKTGKQDPVKAAPSGNSTSSKTGTKVDTTSGATRMAISEQGTAKKNKNKAKKSTPIPTPTPTAPKQ